MRRGLVGTIGVIAAVSAAMVFNPVDSVAQDAPRVSSPERLSIESVVVGALETDRTTAVLERQLAEQIDSLGLGRYRDALRLTLTAGLSGALPDAPTYSGAGSLGASVDVLPQLTLSGSLTTRVDTGALPGREPDAIAGEIGFTFSPLADAGGRSRDKLSLAVTEQRIVEAARKAAYTVITQLFSAVAARAEVELAAERSAITTARLEQAQLLFGREMASAAELAAAQNAERVASNAAARASLEADRTLDALSLTLQRPLAASDLPDWDALGVVERTASVVGLRSGISTETVVGHAPRVVSAMLDVRSAELALATTRTFAPQLSLSGSFGLPGSTYSAEARLSVSPADLDRDAKREATEDVAFASWSLENARRTAAFAVASVLLDFDGAVGGIDASTRTLDLARQELARVRIRHDRGDVTRLALREAERTVTEATAALSSAYAAALRAWYVVELMQW